MRPEDLAVELGISAKTLRQWLRDNWPRPPAELSKPWNLTAEQVQAARSRWLAAPSPSQDTTFSSKNRPTEWRLHQGDVIRRTELHNRYGGSGQGGISPSRTTPNVMIFTDRRVGEKHGYLDRWEGTILHYTGEGQRGNQVMAKGNKAIRDHVDDRRSLRVFEGSAGNVTYVGEFGLDRNLAWYTDRAPETGGGPMRDVIMFRLVPLGRIESEGRKLEPAQVKPALSAAYVPVPADPQTATPQVYQVDPDLVDRGRKGHRQTQNAVAEWAEQNGFTPLRPVAGDPPFDVGWWDGDTFDVVEVKSLTSANEIHQLRLGLGQVLDYAHQLKEASVVPRPILATETRPTGARWVSLCRDLGVDLVWPGSLDTLLD